MIAILLSVRPNKPCFVDSVSHVLLVSLTVLAPIILPPPRLKDFSSFAYFLAVYFCICSHHVLNEASLRMIGLGTGL